MSLDPSLVLSLFNAVLSHASASGQFERVNGHEPKSRASVAGLTAAVWLDVIRSAQASGLATTSAVLDFNVRIYAPMITDAPDAVDPAMTMAASALVAAYAGDLRLGDTTGSVRCVDLRGMTGRALEARAGYLNQDSTLFRIITITVPVIINDAWDEVP